MQTADGPDAYHALLRELAESSDEYRSRLEETASEEGEGGGNLAVADEVLNLKPETPTLHPKR
jgi:hypothetical protein